MEFFIYSVIAIVVVVCMYHGRYYMGFVGLSSEVIRERYSNEQSQFIKLEGMQQNINLHYRDEGLSVEDNPDAPVLILLHGIMASLHTWDGWVDALGKDFRIIRVDIPGFGLTGPYSDGIYNLDRAIDMIDQLSDRLGIKSFSLAGNSMGGYISWSFSIAHPEKVERLVLLDSVGYIFDLPVMLEILNTPILKQGISFVTPRFIVKQTLKQVYGDRSKITEDTVERYHELMLREGNRKSVVSVLASIIDINDKKIKQVSAPTLIQWGERDRWIPLEHAVDFATDIKHAQLISYPGVGHMPMEEIPQQSAADAKAFLLPTTKHL